jgi:retron-type reverse transcriptase
VSGKRARKDNQEFERNLMTNIICLHFDLKNKTYVHSPYQAFNISDPKPRNIHKASVRDRLLHHAIYRILYPHFDKLFISDSYSCRLNKGTHRALKRFESFSGKVSKNNTKQCWVLKCDVRKFFASIDQGILLNILKRKIQNQDVIWLSSQIISSFNSGKEKTGLPLGNLTSQLLVNIYMNEFDQWMKHKMKVKYYIRYADDFVILSQDKDYLLELTPKIADFLEENLKLSLHPNKVSIKTLSSGVDFLGWVHFSHHRVLRTATKKKMFRNLRLKEGKQKENSVNSYLGMLGWGSGYKLSKILKSLI